MSVGSVSGYDFESMRARFESFRNGQSRFQKADLEEVKAAASPSSSQAASAASPLDELIGKFSEIDTNGDGISGDELQAAVENGTVSGPPPSVHGPKGGGPPPGGPPPGGPPPGGAKGQTGETEGRYTQSNQLGYDLFEAFKKKLEEQKEEFLSATGSTEGTTETSGDSPVTLRELLGDTGSTGSATGSGENDDESLSQQEARKLTRSLAEFIRQIYQQNSSGLAQQATSTLGTGILA